LWRKAATYLRQAGVKAEARSGLLDALEWLKQALGAARRLPEGRTTLEQAFEICLELRLVLIQLAEPRQALEFMREAEVLADRLNDDHRRVRARVLAINLQAMLGELDQACASAERALALALGDSELHSHTTSAPQTVVGRTLIEYDSARRLNLTRLLAFLESFQRFARFAELRQHPGGGGDCGWTLEIKVPRSDQLDPAFDQRTRPRPITLEVPFGNFVS
jgi:tetratricopeptide (TPR) repeat protein